MINSLEAGGAETLLRDSLPRMKALGADPSLLVLSRTGSPLERELLEQGIPVLHTGIPSLGSPRQIAGIRRILRESSPDLVHAHLFPSLYWTALASPRIPGIYTEHSTWNRRRSLSFLRPLEARIYLRYRTVVCIGAAVQKALLHWLPRMRHRTVVIHNGIDLERFHRALPLPRGTVLPQREPGRVLLVMIASFTPKKDHASLIRALGILPERYVLALVGEGPTRSAMMRLARQEGVGNRVVFPGRRTDIPELLKSCDIAVLSSRWEGFGISAVEAMAAGLPLIASKVDGLSDVADGAGLLVEPGDPVALADGIRRVAEDPDLRETLKGRSLERAQQYGIGEMVRKLLALYSVTLDKEVAGR